MSSVTFLSLALLNEVIVPTRGRRTLLSLARSYRIPLRYACQRGNCGSCAVKVAALNWPVPKSVRLDKREKKVLYQTGKLTPQQYASETLTNVPPLWRLACQYEVEDEDILVAF